jgi:hypothetical protein
MGTQARPPDTLRGPVRAGISGPADCGGRPWHLLSHATIGTPLGLASPTWLEADRDYLSLAFLNLNTTSEVGLLIAMSSGSANN